MTINIENESGEEFDFDCEKLLKKVVLKALEREKCPYECEVNIIFTDDDGIRDLNRDYRNLDVPTDVLSFSMAEYKAPADFSELEDDGVKMDCFNPDTNELVLGDIVISVERAMEQAAEYGHSLKREICFLTAHSILHLIGYDHMDDEGRIDMEERQEAVLEELGITRD